MMGFSKGRYIKFYTFITSTKPLTIIYSKKNKKKTLQLRGEKKKKKKRSARVHGKKRDRHLPANDDLGPTSSAFFSSHQLLLGHQGLVDLHNNLLIVLLQWRCTESHGPDSIVGAEAEAAAENRGVGEAEHHPDVGVSEFDEQSLGRGQTKPTEPRLDPEPTEPLSSPLTQLDPVLLSAPGRPVQSLVPPSSPIYFQASHPHFSFFLSEAERREKGREGGSEWYMEGGGCRHLFQVK